MINDHLRRKLKSRHIQMIALGGAVGAGFFLNSPKAAAMTGPAVVLAYLLGALIVYVIMRSLAEITVQNPLSGSYIEYASYYLNDRSSFILGWNNWIIFILICVLEMHTITFLLNDWLLLPHWIIYLGLIILCYLFNIIGIQWFGEAQFWLVIVKVMVIILIIIAGVWITLSHTNIKQFLLNNFLHSYSKDYSSGLIFNHGLNGFAKSIFIVCLSFCGIELASIASGEAINPAVSVPRAVNGVLFKVIVFYISTVIIILLMSSSKITSNHHQALPHILSHFKISSSQEFFNLLAVLASFSALNSFVYGSSRVLYRTALNKHAPKQLAQINTSALPSNSIFFTLITVFALALALDGYFAKQFLNYAHIIIVSGIIINWYLIMLIHFVFRKSIKFEKGARQSKYKIPFYPYLNLIVLVLLLLIIVSLLLDRQMRLSIMIIPLWVLFLMLCYKAKQLVYKPIQN